MTEPPDLQESDPPPGASWYKALLAWVRSMRVTVARDSGLYSTSGPSGTAIGVRFPPAAYLGKTTTILQPRSGETPGSGTVQPLTYTGTVLAPFGGTITVLNWTGTQVVQGQRIEYNTMYGRYWLEGHDCSGVA